MSTTAIVSERAQQSWERALMVVHGSFEPECFAEAGNLLVQARQELESDAIHTTERDAQQMRIYRGMGLVPVCQALAISRFPDDAQKAHLDIEGYLGQTDMKLQEAIELGRPYLEGDAAIQPFGDVNPDDVRTMLRREFGMTLAAKGLLQFTGNVLRHDKTRDMRQPAIVLAHDELIRAGSSADHAGVAYLGARAEHYRDGWTAESLRWCVRNDLFDGQPDVEHHLIRKITDIVAARKPR
ncbi:MAG TPA: hypothetical protein VJP80_06400 [Candidatus Saccharimonadales bacterium]|nr:hypothetical protein [Candidatus Saccharimonadales bacterium]